MDGTQARESRSRGDLVAFVSVEALLTLVALFALNELLLTVVLVCTVLFPQFPQGILFETTEWRLGWVSTWAILLAAGALARGRWHVRTELIALIQLLLLILTMLYCSWWVLRLAMGLG